MQKLIISKKNKIKAIAWLDSLIDSLDDKNYLISVKKIINKRSLNANAYAWVLIDKLGAYYNMSPEYIYKNMVTEISGNSVIITVNADAAESMIKIWESRGLGWQAIKLDEYGDNIDYRLVYGSSVYDTRQMSQLIDLITADCKQVGIETLEEKEVKSIIEEWGK